MDSESQVIREQMDHTRASLTDKLEELEKQVMGSVQDATSVVRDTVEEVMHTVESVKESVHDTVESVRGSVSGAADTMRETFDIKHQVDAHPWMMLAGATAVGYIAGTMLSPAPAHNGHHHYYDNGHAPGHQFATAGHPVEHHQQAQHPVKEKLGGLLDMLGEPMTQELNMLKGMAIGAALAMARDALSGSVPPQFQRIVDEGINTIGKRMGAQPVASGNRQQGAPPRMQQPQSGHFEGGKRATAGV